MKCFLLDLNLLKQKIIYDEVGVILFIKFGNTMTAMPMNWLGWATNIISNLFLNSIFLANTYPEFQTHITSILLLLVQDFMNGLLW